MIEHMIIWPILIPMIGGLLMLLPPFKGIERYAARRVFAVLLILAQIATAIAILLPSFNFFFTKVFKLIANSESESCTD